MAQHSSSIKKVLVFDESNFYFWKVRMESYLMALVMDLQNSVVEGYEILENPPRDQIRKRAYEINAKNRNAILCGSTNTDFSKVMECKTTKEI